MACSDAVLQTLIDNFTASGSREDHEELVFYIEDVTNQPISSLLQPEWSQVAADGVQRIKTINVSNCILTLTMDATPSSTGTCDTLPTSTLFLAQNDFDLPVTVTDVNPAEPTAFPWPDYYQTSTVPEATLHIDNPRQVWLQDTPGADEELIDQWPLWTSGVLVGGVRYRPAIRINLSYTAKLNIQRRFTHAITGEYEVVDESYTLFPPPAGLTLVQRNETSTPSISDPIRLGTWSGSAVQDTDYNSMTSTSVHDDTNMTIEGQPRLALPAHPSLDASSLEDFQDEVNAYNASKTIYQPDVSFDAETLEVTVSYMTRENAFYFRNVFCSLESTVYNAITVDCGGYLHPLGEGTPSEDDDEGALYMQGILRRIIVEDDPTCFVTHTNWGLFAPTELATYMPSIGAAVGDQVDGEPPDTVSNPPRPPAEGSFVPVPPPVSGGCRSTMDGPASCNYNVPLEPDFDDPELPLPGDVPVFPDEFPEMPFPEMPIFDANYPQFPNFCAPPDFGQMTDCKPQPGTNFMPGGRDREGNQGTNLASFKTGGELYGAYDTTFNQDFPIDDVTGEFPEDPDTGEPIVPPQRCWPENSSIMTAITTILLDLGVSPLNIVWEIGPEWDKTFGPHCFPTTTGMFDAAVWLAQKLMLRIIDEGAPSGKVYIGPPTHRPQSQTFTFQDTYYPGISTNPPFANLAHGYSQSEAYFAVKVWGSHLPEPAWAIVDTPFAKDPTSILEVQVGPNYSFAEAQELAFFRASLIRRAAVSVQVTVPYSENYYMRDTMILQVPSAGYQETFTIFGKQSEWSVESRAHILTGVLPATLAELDQFPELLEEPEPLMGAFLDWPKMRSATKRKGERRLLRSLDRRERLGMAVR